MKSPGEEPVDAVNPAKQMIRDDRLTQRHRDDVPQHSGEAEDRKHRKNQTPFRSFLARNRICVFSNRRMEYHKQVSLESELIIEKDAVIDLSHETNPDLNGQIIYTLMK